MKKIMFFLGAAFFVLITDCYVEKAQKREIISDIAMENVEALAYYEIELPEVTITCGQKGGKCWMEVGYCYVGEYTYKKCEFIGEQAWSCNGIC